MLYYGLNHILQKNRRTFSASHNNCTIYNSIRLWTRLMDTCFLVTSCKTHSLQPPTHPTPPAVLSIPLMGGNSCGVTPSHMTWAGGRNLCGTSIPPFFPPILSLSRSECQPYTHGHSHAHVHTHTHMHATSFEGCGHFELQECAPCL